MPNSPPVLLAWGQPADGMMICQLPMHCHAVRNLQSTACEMRGGDEDVWGDEDVREGPGVSLWQEGFR